MLRVCTEGPRPLAQSPQGSLLSLPGTASRAVLAGRGVKLARASQTDWVWTGDWFSLEVSAPALYQFQVKILSPAAGFVALPVKPPLTYRI